MMNHIETELLENVKEFVGFARKRLGDPELGPMQFRKACSKR